MRRAQSVRHYARPSLALGADDLGMLKESPDESNEDVLRRQLLEKDRENDKLQTQIQSLQAQLAQRPPLETIQALEREYKNLELLLQGTQRENERAMTELERGKTREKMLERELSKLAGENWQANLEISPAPPAFVPRSATSFLQAAQGLAGSADQSGERGSKPSNEETMAHIEQVRLLILGMEQRLATREDKLTKAMARADSEGTKFEEMRKKVMTA
ncbi:hypothetical protein EVG20_g2106 [Dentipellis fragilis]|uniref:Uncharacterized protein n=1 Tax=Dentipellis fragilis TaxID=205917 RepID=A0A4Y9Z8N7_9AGAM|nr:hypothetical protein EVG20_g2106 [Dentipellis fragilis]